MTGYSVTVSCVRKSVLGFQPAVSLGLSQSSQTPLSLQVSLILQGPITSPDLVFGGYTELMFNKQHRVRHSLQDLEIISSFPSPADWGGKWGPSERWHAGQAKPFRLLDIFIVSV